jgi:hypothetical protein
MLISKLKVLGAATLACVLAIGGLQTFALQPGDESADGSAKAAPDRNERQAKLERSIEKIGLQLRESAALTSKLQVELDELRAQLQTLDAENPPGAAKAFGKGVGAKSAGKSAITKQRSVMPPMAKGAPADAANGQAAPRFLRIGKWFFVTSAIGDKVTVYDSDTGKAKSIRLPASKDAPLKAVPIIGQDLWALMLEGPHITQIAVYDSTPQAGGFGDGAWFPHDLREPVENNANPLVGPNGVVYALGRYVYAFSAALHRWSVLELPEGAQAAPTSGNDTVEVEHNGHLYIFSFRSGKWRDIDTRAILDADEDRDEPARKR